MDRVKLRALALGTILTGSLAACRSEPPAPPRAAAVGVEAGADSPRPGASARPPSTGGPATDLAERIARAARPGADPIEMDRIAEVTRWPPEMCPEGAPSTREVMEDRVPHALEIAYARDSPTCARQHLGEIRDQTAGLAWQVRSVRGACPSFEARVLEATTQTRGFARCVAYRLADAFPFRQDEGEYAYEVRASFDGRGARDVRDLSESLKGATARPARATDREVEGASGWLKASPRPTADARADR